MPHADVQPVRVVHQLKKAADVVAVIERLADAHEHDVGDLAPGIELRKEHLIEHLRGGQVAHLAGDGARAEGAAHAAAHL